MIWACQFVRGTTSMLVAFLKPPACLHSNRHNPISTDDSIGRSEWIRTSNSVIQLNWHDIRRKAQTAVLMGSEPMTLYRSMSQAIAIV
jgi:hypothetical protein